MGITSTMIITKMSTMVNISRITTMAVTIITNHITQYRGKYVQYAERKLALTINFVLVVVLIAKLVLSVKVVMQRLKLVIHSARTADINDKRKHSFR